MENVKQTQKWKSTMASYTHHPALQESTLGQAWFMGIPDPDH